MNDYRELIETIRAATKNPIFKTNNDIVCVSTEALESIANAIEQLLKECNAAIADLKEYASCDYCKHSNAEYKEYCNIGECGLHGLCSGEKFEWRGIRE